MPARCSVCALPPVVRRECEDRLQRRGLSLRVVASYCVDLGHVINKDSLANHLRHLGPGSRPDTDVLDTADSASLVALAARDVLEDWPARAARLAQRLYDDGLPREGGIVMADLAEDVQGAIEATRGTEAGLVVQVKVLSSALRVVMPRHPLACHEVATELTSLGAPDDLSSAFEWLATKPLTTSDPQKETSA